MKIKSRILIFPMLLFLTFFVIYIILNNFNDKNKLLLGQTKNIYIPEIEAIAQLKYSFHELQKTLQDAVASSEEIKLSEADSIAANFKNLCLLYKSIKKDTLKDTFLFLFDKYYKNARIITKKMMTEDFSDDLVNKIDAMIAQHNKILTLLEKQEIESKNSVSEHFRNIEKNNEKSEITNLVVALAGFIISIIVAFIIGNALVKPFIELNGTLQNNKEELKQMNEELSSVNDNILLKNDELKNALQMLKDTQAQLVQSEKMASVGILTAGIAHEINNPLNFIQGAKIAIENYLLENLKEHSSKLFPFTEIIDTGVKRAAAIVDHLNHFTQKGKTSKEKLDLHSVIDNCILMLQGRLNNRIEIQRNYTLDAFLITGNEGKLHQVFLNIFENSIQAIKDFGIISISTVIIDRNVEISITDNGSGISEEHLPKIVDPFFTTKGPGKGTGLGLAIVYNLILEHYGTIKFQSELGKGTTVIIQFPLSEI